MRRSEFAMSSAEARALLAELPVIHLASTRADGEPVLRAVHGVVIDDWIAFHAAPKGEKTELLGRAAVVQAEETVATVPSTFFDDEKACPATTYYRSVQVRGPVEEICDPTLKARALQALMEKLQPDGGHVPITADHPHYRGPVNGLLIAGLRLERLTGKAKLAQNRKPLQIRELLTSLWCRGEPGDARALELIRAANPDAPVPDFLTAPAGATLHAWLSPSTAGEAADLLSGEYWNTRRFTRDELVRAHRGDHPRVGARDAKGRLIASARAISDGAKQAWIYDVAVAPDWRGRGVGQALMRLLIDHPRLRHTRNILLATRDAQSLYARFGFIDRGEAPPLSFAATEMIFTRR